MSMDLHKVHNVGILGHGGVGKTTLIEHILHDAGAINRLGTVEEGNTVCDYLEEEINHKHSIALKLTHVMHKGARIHMVDHPGYPDFISEVASSVAVLDSVIIVVDANTGPQVGTDNAWKYAQKYKVPRSFYINKLDMDTTDFFKTVDALRETYGKHCVPLMVPKGDPGHITGIAHIVEGNGEGVHADVDTLKEMMTDVVAEAKESLLDKYLETGKLSHDEFVEGLHEGLANGKIVPIIAGCAKKNIGCDELLALIAETFPTPLDRHVLVENAAGEMVELKVDAKEPFVAQVFRTTVDPYVGQLSFFRVLTGTLKSDSEFHNVNTGAKERTGKIFLMNGKNQEAVAEVGPGDLAAITKLKDTHFGNTITALGVELKAPDIEMPHAVIKLAIVPKTRSDEDKIGEALNRMAEEDPTFSHYRDNDTNEHLICGVGDQQLALILERMQNKFHVEAETQPPRIAYRETIKGKSEVQGKHKKQSGGHGQYGDVQLRLSPSPRGEGYKFIDGITGGVVPKQYIPHVDKGCHDALQKGVISGHPVVDVTVELFFGSYHNVDSSEMAFKIAASMAIQKGVREAKPCILEPIVEIAVVVPDECMGDVTGDLSSRRGRILGMEPKGGGRQCVRAHVPEAEILTYSTVLRSMTAGRGSYDLHFDHYEEVPDNIAKELIAAYEKDRAEGH